MRELAILEKGRTEDDEAGAHDGSHGAAAHSLERQEDARNKRNTTEGREEAHGNVGHTRLEIVLANLLEVEITIEASEPASQSNQHLGEGRVDVHEEAALDVLGSKATKAEQIQG